MANYSFACFDCEEQWEVFGILMADRDKPQKCIHCDSYECVKRILQPVSFSFAESNRIGESAKPHNYWENAEKEKNRKLVKKQNDAIEQGFYNDPKCPKKFKDIKRHVK